jgi:CRISPR-associated protein (TIGR02584 family)
VRTFRDILVAVVGLTPQVITETVYYLTQIRQPPATLAAIHILTTRRGHEQVHTQLLASPGGHFYACCAEYGLDPTAIEFEVHILKDAAHVPLEDIRTAADSAAVADQIIAHMQRLTSDPTTRLFCSLAGGRKTQSVLLGFALQLYGRPQDTLLHVLVDAALENHPEFFYPPRTARLLRTRDGRWLDAGAARIDVAEIPYLRLRDKLFNDTASAATGFAPTIVHGQRLLDALPDLPPLVITYRTRRIRIGTAELQLPPLEFILYAHLARLRLDHLQSLQGEGFVTLDDLEQAQDELLRRHAGLYSPHAERVATLRRQWARGFPRDSIRAHFAHINRQMRRLIPDPTLAVFYRISSERGYGNTRYGLRLPREKITLPEEER